MRLRVLGPSITALLAIGVATSAATTSAAAIPIARETEAAQPSMANRAGTAAAMSGSGGSMRAGGEPLGAQPLAQGSALPRLKIEVDADGVYALTGAMLAEAGWALADARTDRLRLTSQGDAVAFELDGASGEALSPASVLRFYGQRFRGDRLARRYAGINLHWASFNGQTPDGNYTSWTPTLDAMMFEKYTATNVYWLSADDSGGRRMAVADASPAQAAPADPSGGAFTDTAHFEESHEWFTHHFTSSDTWFWARLIAAEAVTRSFAIVLPGARPASLEPAGTTATLRAEFVSRSARRDHRSTFTWNGLALKDAVWHGKSRYRLTATLPLTAVLPMTNTFTWTMLPGATPDDVYFDWLDVTYRRDLAARGESLIMKLPVDPQAPAVHVTELPGTAALVYDISDPLRPVRLQGVASSQAANGSLSADFALPVTGTVGTGRTLWVGSDALANRRPLRIVARPDPRPDLIGAEASYLVIAPASLKQGSQRLAEIHRNLGAAVVDLDDLYDAYNFGIRNPIAIRNFLADAFATWDKPPEYAVLVGDGHWDLRGYQGNDPNSVLMPPSLAWVDPWQGEVDSPNLLATVGDDDPVADLAIARLPVNDEAELGVVVDKIEAYEGAPAGRWQMHQLFVTDNPDAEGAYNALSDATIQKWFRVQFEPLRVYLSDYAGRCQSGARSQCQAATDDIVRYLSDGALIANYTGHASVDSWAGEQIFSIGDIPRLTNAGRLPFVLSWSCLDGYWYYPGRVGMAEQLLRAPSTGAIAVFSATGLGVATGHDILQRGIYQAIYQGKARTFGEITQAAKRALAASGRHPDLLQTYVLFGDPALELRMPTNPQLNWPLLLPFVGRNQTRSFLSGELRSAP